MKTFDLFISVLLISTSSLAEIKNSQSLLGGLVTRAGVKNQQPLSRSELKDLCEAGYTQAFYTYSGATKQSVTCSKGTIHYESNNKSDDVLDAVLEAYNGGGRVFIHCNNGAHMSGFHAALVLRQFCGLSGAAAFSYWEKTLNGYPLNEPNRTTLKNRMAKFEPRVLALTAKQQAQLKCPPN